jgi:hypothetical protein
MKQQYYLASVRKGRELATLTFSTRAGEIYEAAMPLTSADQFTQGQNYPLPDGAVMISEKIVPEKSKNAE